MEEQKTFSGIGSNVYLFRKEDFQDGVSFDDPKVQAVMLDVSPYKSRFYTTDNPNPKAENWCQSFSCSGKIEFPFELPIDGNRGVFCGDDEQERICDVTIQTKEGQQYLLKDAHIQFNCCPILEQHKPLLVDKLHCNMVTPLCYPLRWGDKHFNRRISHYQWMKQNNYL